MKTLKTHMALLIVSTAILAISCGKDEDSLRDSGSFTYGGETSGLSMAMYTYQSNPDRIRIMFTNSGGASLRVYWEGPTGVPKGQFSYTNENDYNPDQYFHRGDVNIDEAYARYGTVSIRSLGGDRYDVSFDWMTNEDKWLTGEYKGSIFRSGDSD